MEQIGYEIGYEVRLKMAMAYSMGLIRFWILIGHVDLEIGYGCE